MTWTLVVLLAVGAYGFKALGLVVIGARRLPPALERCIALVPAALLPALVVKDTVTTGTHLLVDARAFGLVVAVVAAWRRAPFVVVVTLAAATTALLRHAA